METEHIPWYDQIVKCWGNDLPMVMLALNTLWEVKHGVDQESIYYTGG